MWVDEPIGHRAVVEGLWSAQRQGRLPHALLFEGRQGIGKYLAASWFAQGVFCALGPGPACGECGPCKRIAADSHADLFRLDPLERELESIGISSICEREGSGERAIESFLSLRPLEGSWRVGLVREFERATVPAQNALLKTLEEPGDSALLVLETSRRALLLETVISRCVPVHLAELSTAEGSEVLAREGLIGAEAERLVRWSNGSPGIALDLHRQGALAVRERLAEVLAGELDPLEATVAITGLDGEFPGKTPAARARARARAALDLVLRILRDLSRARSGIPAGELTHGDLVPRAGGSFSAIADSLREGLALRGDLELNLSPEGVLDAALMALSRAGSRGAEVSSR